MKPKVFSYPQLVKKLPLEVKTLFKVFGGEIRLVGGCVRDLFLNKEVNDFDFATKFLPEKIIKVLTENNIKAVPTGIRFGTITAVVNGKNFEITTLRKDGATDGRWCDPEFVDDYFLDATRRDFTINALYLDLEGALYDYCGGIADLKKQKVRFIGDSATRISEDFLRILRFFRFSCNYAKSLDAKGLKACIQQKENLKKLSRERIRAEFLKIISSQNKKNLFLIINILQSKKIAEEIFFSNLDIKALKRLLINEKKLGFAVSLNLKLATLFIEKNLNLRILAEEICATNLEKKYFQFLLVQQNQPANLNDLKQLLAFFSKDFVLDFYLLSLAKSSETIKIKTAKQNIKFLEQSNLLKFPLDGNDLLELGLENKQLGQALEKAKKFWAQNNFKSNKKELLDFLRSA